MQDSFDSSRPIYAQIVERLKRENPRGRVSAGRSSGIGTGYGGGNRRKPEYDAARALAQLETEGLVRTERTAGRYVTEDTDLIDALRLPRRRAWWRIFSKR